MPAIMQVPGRFSDIGTRMRDRDCPPPGPPRYAAIDRSAANHRGQLPREGRMPDVTVDVAVNGVSHRAQVPARTLLVHFLRGNLRLTGTHVGCDTTQCGACTVALDGVAVKSCTVLAAQASDHEVTTIEGLAPGSGAITARGGTLAAGDSQSAPREPSAPPDAAPLHPVQRAFWRHHGLQCGYCTPGM